MWVFDYRHPETGEECEMDAKPGAPYFLEFQGKIFEFSGKHFVTEGAMSLNHFYQRMNSTPCPPVPTRPAQAPETAFGSWTPASAKEAADRMDSAQLRCACEADPQFAAALDTLKKELPQLQGISQAAKDAAVLTELANRNKGRGFDFQPSAQQPPSMEILDVGRGELIQIQKPDERKPYYRSIDLSNKEKP